MDELIAPGRLLFGLAIIAIGAENVLCASSGGDVLPVIPWAPANAALGYLIGLGLVAAGLCIAANVKRRPAAIWLGAFFFACVLILELPNAVASPRDLSIRTAVFEAAALCGAAWSLAAALPPGGPPSAKWTGRLHQALLSGRYLFALSAVVFGVTHLLIPDFIASLIPAWIPGRLAWAYFTGVAFIAAGASLATGWLDRWAATLLGAMFLSWVLLVHTPRVLSAAHSHDPDEWSSAFIALALCGASWLMVRPEKAESRVLEPAAV